MRGRKGVASLSFQWRNILDSTFQSFLSSQRILLGPQFYRRIQSPINHAVPISQLKFVSSNKRTHKKNIDPLQMHISSNLQISGKCPGCGSILQSEDPNIFGYLPKSKAPKVIEEKKANYRKSHDYSELFAEELAELKELNRREREQLEAQIAEQEAKARLSLQSRNTKLLNESFLEYIPPQEPKDQKKLSTPPPIDITTFLTMVGKIAGAVSSADKKPQNIQNMEVDHNENLDQEVSKKKLIEKPEIKTTNLKQPEIIINKESPAKSFDQKEDRIQMGNGIEERVEEFEEEIGEKQIERNDSKSVQLRKKNTLYQDKQEKSLQVEEEKWMRVDVFAQPMLTEPKKKEKKPHNPICQRCFMLKHYNKVLPLHVPVETFRNRLQELQENNKKMIVLKVVDIFDFNGSFIPDFYKIVGNNPLILVGNKADLLPKNAKEARVINWMRRAAKSIGLRVKDVYLISALNGQGVKQLIDGVMPFVKDGRDLYVMGTSNAGKSTFINKMMTIMNEGKENPAEATMSHIPGTTLSTIAFPLPHGLLFDTPGIYNKNQIVNMLTTDEIKMILPKHKIKPVAFTLQPGKTLFIAGLARIDYISGPNAIFIPFVANTLYLHTTSTAKADELYKTHLGTLLQPPFPPSAREGKGDLPPLIPKEFEIEGIGWDLSSADLVVPGLGWVGLTSKGIMRVKCWSLEGTEIVVREEPLMPFETPASGKKRKIATSHL